MNRFALAALIALFAIGIHVAPREAFAKKELCLVCKVKEGAVKTETVKATRTYYGIRYGFCSDGCAKEFDADPIAYLPPKFPRPGPAISISDLGGRDLGSSLKGKVVLLDFWATWCAPCQKSMPELQGLHDKYSGRGFAVVGVSIDEKEDADAKVKKFITKKKITYPIAIDSKKSPLWEKYRVKAVPAAFLLNRQGNIVAQWTGAPPRAREVEKELAALLGRAG